MSFQRWRRGGRRRRREERGGRKKRRRTLDFLPRVRQLEVLIARDLHHRRLPTTRLFALLLLLLTVLLLPLLLLMVRARTKLLMVLVRLVLFLRRRRLTRPTRPRVTVRVGVVALVVLLRGRVLKWEDGRVERAVGLDEAVEGLDVGWVLRGELGDGRQGACGCQRRGSAEEKGERRERRTGFGGAGQGEDGDGRGGRSADRSVVDDEGETKRRASGLFFIEEEEKVKLAVKEEGETRVRTDFPLEGGIGLVPDPELARSNDPPFPLPSLLLSSLLARQRPSVLPLWPIAVVLPGYEPLLTLE